MNSLKSILDPDFNRMNSPVNPQMISLLHKRNMSPETIEMGVMQLRIWIRVALFRALRDIRDLRATKP